MATDDSDKSNEAKPFIRDYGMVIVDECHHAHAISFELAYWAYVFFSLTFRRVYGI